MRQTWCRAGSLIAFAVLSIIGTRLALAQTTCPLANEFYNGTQCDSCATCAVTGVTQIQYQQKTCTDVNDTICTLCSACTTAVPSYEVAACSATSDTKCVDVDLTVYAKIVWEQTAVGTYLQVPGAFRSSVTTAIVGAAKLTGAEVGRIVNLTITLPGGLNATTVETHMTVLPDRLFYDTYCRATSQFRFIGLTQDAWEGAGSPSTAVLTAIRDRINATLQAQYSGISAVIIAAAPMAFQEAFGFIAYNVTTEGGAGCSKVLPVVSGLATTSFRDELKLLSPSAFGAITGVTTATTTIAPTAVSPLMLFDRVVSAISSSAGLDASVVSGSQTVTVSAVAAVLVMNGTSAADTTTAAPEISDSSGFLDLSTAEIIGIGVGIFVGIVLCVLCLCWCCVAHRQRQHIKDRIVLRSTTNRLGMEAIAPYDVGSIHGAPQRSQGGYPSQIHYYDSPRHAPSPHHAVPGGAVGLQNAAFMTPSSRRDLHPQVMTSALRSSRHGNDSPASAVSSHYHPHLAPPGTDTYVPPMSPNHPAHRQGSARHHHPSMKNTSRPQPYAWSDHGGSTNSFFLEGPPQSDPRGHPSRRHQTAADARSVKSEPHRSGPAPLHTDPAIIDDVDLKYLDPNTREIVQKARMATLKDTRFATIDNRVNPRAEDWAVADPVRRDAAGQSFIKTVAF